MKLPDAVIDKLRDKESPVTHSAVVEGGEMTIRYTCDGKAIGQTMFAYTPEAWFDWFRSMMEEMSPGTVADTKKIKLRLAESAGLPTLLNRVGRIRENAPHGVLSKRSQIIADNWTMTIPRLTRPRLMDPN
jgi:hypothetical protein